MRLKVHCTYILAQKQVQTIHDVIQTCHSGMTKQEIIEKIYDKLGSDPIPPLEELKTALIGVWYILGLPGVLTVRDAYKFYIRSLERVK